MALDLITLKETEPFDTMKDIIMKTLISTILCFGLTLLFTGADLFAQQAERQMVPLSEENFECFQQISCLTGSKDLQHKGWFFHFDETITGSPQERTARMQGVNIDLTAHYDKNGNLLRGMYWRKDAALPPVLLAHLTNEDFSGWRMTGNEITVQDFNITSAVYNITLESERGEKTVTFTHSDVANMKRTETPAFARN